MTAVPRFTQSYRSKNQACQSGDLYHVITDAKTRADVGLDYLTVLSTSTDPYRMDTWNGGKPGINHANGQWVADLISYSGLSGTVHIRGLHYIAVSLGQPRPTGKGRSSAVAYVPYRNDAKSWEWLQTAVSHARWLGYIEFDQIHDARNAEPVIRLAEDHDAEADVDHDHGWWIPDGEPDIDLPRFGTRQPYQLVIVGEKSSLGPMVEPIADEFAADVYLPNGHLSTTLTYRMARKAYDDERPLVVAYLADCDPWGWQMPEAVARKLQALSDSHLPGLEFEVHRVGLTPDQVREHELPSAPLEKGTPAQRRAWEEATDVGQTELDAALVLAPELLPRLIRAKLSSYFDPDLEGRNEQIKEAWLREARRAYAEAPISAERAEALDWLRRVQERMPDIARILDETVPAVELPPEPESSSAVAPGAMCEALVTDGEFLRVTELLREDRDRFGAIEGDGGLA